MARRVHLWIALGLGLHFSLIATTGGIFVFHQELTNVARTWRGWAATEGDIGADPCAAAIAQAYPEWDRAWLTFPAKDQPFYAAFIGGDTDDFWTDVFVDPGSGQIVGSVNNLSWSIEGLLQVSIQLHIRLCAGEWGRKFVDVSVALLLVELCTGLFLWWPGRKHIFRGFQIRVRKRFLAVYDWHRVSGVLAAPPVLVMTLTGLLWGFPQIMVPLVYWSCGETPPTVSPRGAIASALILPEADPDRDEFCSWSEVAQVARTIDPQLSIAGIYFHGPQQRIARVTGVKVADSDGGFPQENTIEIDRQTRQRVFTDPLPSQPSMADRFVNDWAHPLHYGDFGGIATKLLYLAACCTVDGLFVTGLWMWWVKTTKARSRSAPSVLHNSASNNRSKFGLLW